MERLRYRPSCRSSDRTAERLSARSVCKINAFSIDISMPVKYREMKGKRVNVADNETFENPP
ncbi:hypothetical protein [Bacteroides pyogenes]|uniref:hypothetical protein n=1 Tax=Bacteroides pyogenes TaxID=310300 RepID=UPI002FD9269F